MSSVERNVAEDCRFSGPVPCRPFVRSLLTITWSINSYTGFRVHALSTTTTSLLHVSTLTSSLGNRISLIQAMKPDPWSHVMMTFSKATRLCSRWSNFGKSSSSSCDSRAVNSATAWKSLACEAIVASYLQYILLVPYPNGLTKFCSNRFSCQCWMTLRWNYISSRVALVYAR